MSKYEKTINLIKQLGSQEWLTPSQQKIMHVVGMKFKTHKVINIYGGVGVGKTFLGWQLEKCGLGKYVVNREGLQNVFADRVILDNASSERYETRRLRDYMIIHSISQLILITNKPIDDYIPKLELHFNEDDKDKVKSNLYEYCVMQVLNEDISCNIHKLIMDNL